MCVVTLWQGMRLLMLMVDMLTLVQVTVCSLLRAGGVEHETVPTYFSPEWRFERVVFLERPWKPSATSADRFAANTAHLLVFHPQRLDVPHAANANCLTFFQRSKVQRSLIIDTKFEHCVKKIEGSARESGSGRTTSRTARMSLSGRASCRCGWCGQPGG